MSKRTELEDALAFQVKLAKLPTPEREYKFHPSRRWRFDFAWPALYLRIAVEVEGAIFVAGAAVQWLRDGLHAIQASSEVQQLAQSVPDSGGVVFVPAFTGLGAPYWDTEARGMITGITRGTSVAHIARAALESIAYQSTALLQSMNKDAKANGGVAEGFNRVHAAPQVSRGLSNSGRLLCGCGCEGARLDVIAKCARHLASAASLWSLQAHMRRGSVRCE